MVAVVAQVYYPAGDCRQAFVAAVKVLKHVISCVPQYFTLETDVYISEHNSCQQLKSLLCEEVSDARVANSPLNIAVLLPGSSQQSSN